LRFPNTKGWGKHVASSSLLLSLVPLLHLLLLQLAGASFFKAVAAETKDVYAYVFSTAAGSPTHVLAWRPTAVGDTELPTDSALVQFDVGFAAAASAAYALNGAAPSGSVAVALPSVGGSTWSMRVSGVPTLVVLSA
jgi:hypothetical protein